MKRELFKEYEVCPRCGFEYPELLSTMNGEADFEGEILKERYCPHCKYKWREIYSFAYNELPDMDTIGYE